MGEDAHVPASMKWLDLTALSSFLTPSLLPQDGYNKQITYRNGESAASSSSAPAV